MTTRPLTRQNHTVTLCDLAIALLKEAKKCISSYSEKDLDRDIIETIVRFNNEGLSFLCRTLPVLSSGLLDHLEGRPGRYPNFGKFRSCEYPSYLKGVFAAAYDYNHAEHTIAVGFIYQYANAFKKLKGPYSKEILHSQMEDFIRVDESLPLNFIEADLPIIDLARSYITSLFNDISIDEQLFVDQLTPRPGPGATNKPVAPLKRFEINNFFRSIDAEFPFCEWFYPHYGDFAGDIPSFRQKYYSADDEPYARFKYVDKQVGKARGICIEMNETQYFQQAIKAYLYKRIENHPLTKGFVNFTSQNINRDLAMRSSIDGSLATLDMKDASDRISRNLVIELFKDVPVLLRKMLSVSTKYVDVSDYHEAGTIELRKFAPMGSGLCFPVMSLVHWSLIRAIIHLSMQREHSRNVYIYGDDIIVHKDAVQPVYDWLPRFGMKFNESKSFYKSSFRESCGIHAYRGVDITPVYFKYIPGSSLGATAVSSIIANEALLYTQRKETVAALVRERLGRILPFVGETSPCVGWKRPIDNPLIGYSIRDRVKRRWNARFCKFEYRYSVFKMDTEDDNAELTHGSEHAMLLRWHCVRPEIKHDKGLWVNAPVRRANRWVSLDIIYGKRM